MSWVVLLLLFFFVGGAVVSCLFVSSVKLTTLTNRGKNNRQFAVDPFTIKARELGHVKEENSCEMRIWSQTQG